MSPAVCPTTDEPLIRYLDAGECAEALRRQAAAAGATQFACVRNLGYRLTPFDLYPLAPLAQPPLGRVAAFAVDMDGTSTTTEPLALHALEYMVRRITGRMDPAVWPGLDPRRDHPFVIGNSNWRHVEFLVERYGEHVDRAALCAAFIEALCWTTHCLRDTSRPSQVAQTAQRCGLRGLLDDPDFRRLERSGDLDEDALARSAAALTARYGPAFRCAQPAEMVGAALDVYYMRYHSILRQLERGTADDPPGGPAVDAGRPLVDAMPGYDVFLALVKGWLGPEAEALFEPLCAQLAERPPAADLDDARERFLAAGRYFERCPARLALVTASIAFEARTVMRHVLCRVRERVADWPLSAQRREALLARLADERAAFDAFVTASDACEHRLKPHPDLYSLALRDMALPVEDYPFVVGLEDTEPGIVALRAAGVRCVIALPNRDTHRQNYAAAARVVRGGLPELLLFCDLVAPDPPLRAARAPGPRAA